MYTLMNIQDLAHTVNEFARELAIRAGQTDALNPNGQLHST